MPWRYTVATVVLCLGILLSVGLFVMLRGLERERMQVAFERAAEDRVCGLQKEMAFHLLILESIRSFYGGSQKVERSEFREFTVPLLQHHPDIQALEWIPRVLDSERPAYEAAARQDGYVNFQIMEREKQGTMVRASRRAEYFPVYSVEPYEGNEIALGYDLAFIAARTTWQPWGALGGENSNSSRSGTL